ncbi:MAG TPA: YfiR family protein [Candidatus Sulfotelmatobacter sp.]|nr:YfiR family protein [Candidatus Sulfotelmatobacter sp.]
MNRDFQAWHVWGKAKRLLRRSFGRARAADRRGDGAFLWTAVGAFLIFAWAGLTKAQATVPLEYQVKASFLYNFSKLTEWPRETFSEREPELVIGIVGEDPFGAAMDRIAEVEKQRGRKLVIKRLRWDQDLKPCHVLFVSRSEKKHLRAILSKVDGAGILTVSEIEGFAVSGGMIEFVFDENRIRFDINREAAQRGNLRISSRLLVLAHAVR